MEFYRAYPAEGNEHQKKEARRKAFARKLERAIQRNLVATRDIDGVDVIWLATFEGGGLRHPTPPDDKDFG
jgi:hypothetical protein